MFLTDKYFQGELYLPVQKISGGAVGYDVAIQISAEDTLGYFIDKYEKEFLRELLGRRLAEKFIEGIQAGTPLSIWVALKDRIYLSEGGHYYSPAANYVYFFAKRDSRTSSTMKGEARDTQDHANAISDVNKLAKAWNDIDPQVRSIYSFLRENWDVYSEYSDGWCIGKRFGSINPFGI